MNERLFSPYFSSVNADPDPQETTEWREAFNAVVAQHGAERAGFLLDQLVALAHQNQIEWSPELVTPYVNTISVDVQASFRGTYP
jgi:pyruvate dehydrogenase E1 component